MSELKKALDVVGFKLPQWEVRKMVEDWDRDTKGPGKGKLSFEEFQNVSPPLFIIISEGIVLIKEQAGLHFCMHFHISFFFSDVFLTKVLSFYLKNTLYFLTC